MNPRREGKEHVKAITLRSGRELVSLGLPPVVTEVETEEANQTRQKEQMQGEQTQEKKEVEKLEERKENEKQADMDEPTPPIPYPQRLKKNKLDKKFTKFMEVFKKLHINIPFTDALEQMPSYVKFMKEILSKKTRLSNYEIVNLTNERALCNLGASINLVPLSIFSRLRLGEARPIIVTLQLVDR